MSFKKLLYLTILILSISSCTVTSPYMATNNELGTKDGNARAVFVFGFPVNGGDYSIRTAARNGEITKVATVDQQISKYGFGIVTIRTTVVTGN